MKSFKQFLKEASAESKYKRGEFGYWWTVIKGRSDIEGKVYQDSINGAYQDLKSLKGAPKKVGGFFDCSYNKLTSLAGAPEEVGGFFDCGRNKLTSLAGAPKKVEGDFVCRGNQLPKDVKIPSRVGHKVYS